MTYNIAGIPLKQILGTVGFPCRRVSLFILLLLSPCFSFAQSDDEDPLDEIFVSLEVKGVGNIDVPAIYHKNDVYLSVTNVFDFLRIRNTPSQSFDSVKGFFLNEQDVFVIDKINERIYYNGKINDVRSDGLLKTETSLFINLKYLKSIFGFESSFYFRRLVVTLSSNAELPVTREMRQELMRRNVSRLRGDVKADTTLKRTHPMFHFGMADWAVMSSQQSQGPDQTTLNLGLGAVIAGGEANASINYYSQQDFSEKLQFYQWRLVRNENPALRQVVAGKIFTQATSTLYAPVVGVQLTNTPTTYRKSYGTYTLSNTTEPNWIVELYVNDVLVDYKKADASGFYSFEVPLIYGYTVVKLRFYGPFGEERTSQQHINIPFNFLPKHEFEYAVNAGIVEDDHNSRFSRLRMNYGLTHRITMGGGVEYLSSVTSGNTMPFLNTSIRLAPRLLVSGEYTHGVRSKGVLSYRLPSSMQVDLDYTKYSKGQTAIYFNYLEERKAVISMPLHARGLSLFTRLTLDQIIVPTSQYMNTEWAFTGFVRRVGINFSTYTSFVKETLPYLYSIASVALPLPAKITFTSQLQYDYKLGKPVFVKFSLEKYLFAKGHLEMAYQEYFYVNNRNILLGLRYDFSFSRMAVSALVGNNNTYSRVEAASGSLIFDAKTNYVNANNRTNVGKGAICIQPYLDLNGNRKKDKDEPKAPGLKVRINGGRVLYSEKDTCIRILDLEPYTSYYLELNRNAFENIAWQLKNKTINVTPNANSFTIVEVPVIVAGEVSGVVSVKGKGNDLPKGQGQIIVCIYDEYSDLAARIITESDGFFSYLGLPPGTYTASIDTNQLHNLHLSATPLSLPVNVTGNKEGDVIDGLEFVLQSTLKDTVNENESEPESVNEETPVKTTGQPVAGATKEKEKPEIMEKKPVTKVQREDWVPEDKQVVVRNGNYAIVVEVYGEIVKAAVLKAKINRYFRLPVYIMQDSIHFKVEMVGFATRKAAAKHLPRLKEWGFPEALIIELDEHRFDSISKQVRTPAKKSVVTVAGAGEISGVVSVRSKEIRQKGLGHIGISVYTKDKLLAKIISESDGFFSYTGLFPGVYTFVIDTIQLRRSGLKAGKPSFTVTMSGIKDADLFDGFEFVLRQVSNSIPADRSPVREERSDAKPREGKKLREELNDAKPREDKKVREERNDAKPREDKKEREEQSDAKPREGRKVREEQHGQVPGEDIVIGHKGSYAILVDVYGDITRAGILKAKIMRAYGLPVSIIQDGDDFKIEIVGFSDREAARRHLPRLKEWGFPEALIIKLKESVVK